MKLFVLPGSLIASALLSVCLLGACAGSGATAETPVTDNSEADQCQDGDSRPAEDGCNTCTCRKGEWACTLKGCLGPSEEGGDSEPTGSEPNDDANGETTAAETPALDSCEPGASRPAEDGCNTCSCKGGKWACTKKACLGQND